MIQFTDRQKTDAYTFALKATAPECGALELAWAAAVIDVDLDNAPASHVLSLAAGVIHDIFAFLREEYDYGAEAILEELAGYDDTDLGLDPAGFILVLQRLQELTGDQPSL